MGRGTLGASRGIVAATSAASNSKGRMSAATQQHLQQARVRRTADGYEVQMFAPGSDTPQTGFFDGTKAGLRKARRAIRGHLGV